MRGTTSQEELTDHPPFEVYSQWSREAISVALEKIRAHGPSLGAIIEPTIQEVLGFLPGSVTHFGQVL